MDRSDGPLATGDSTLAPLLLEQTEGEGTLVQQALRAIRTHLGHGDRLRVGVRGR